MDINPPVMQLIKDDIGMMTDIMAEGINSARKQMQQQRGKQGGQMGWGQHGGMGYMHHGMDMESKENK
jgi:hypothetical protein